jgi:signal transduction histidine kinase
MLQINREQFELSGLNVILDCKNQLKSEALDNENNIRIVLTPPYEKVFIEADRNRLAQVMHNLLINAIHHTKEGVISVCMEIKSKDFRNSKEQEVVVSVKDSGNGIDPCIFPKLFSKFATTSPKGTGLGLFICKSIIEAHGGSIWAKNNNLNRERGGATFYFSLPLFTHGDYKGTQSDFN